VAAVVGREGLELRPLLVVEAVEAQCRFLGLRIGGGGDEDLRGLLRDLIGVLLLESRHRDRMSRPGGLGLGGGRSCVRGGGIVGGPCRGGVRRRGQIADARLLRGSGQGRGLGRCGVSVAAVGIGAACGQRQSEDDEHGQADALMNSTGYEAIISRSLRIAGQCLCENDSMSIPPVPNHPPRPGRRKPAEESPESIPTQLFIGQDGSLAADGSTQALTPEELQRLQSMVGSDGTQATEVLSLEELRRLAAADGYETGGLPAAPRKANSDDIAAAEAASAPKQWNPQGASPARPDTDEPGPAHPNPTPWGPEFGAAGETEAHPEPMRSAGAPASAGALHSQGGHPLGHPGAGPVQPETGSGGQPPAFGPAYAAAPAAGPACGASGPGGPGGPAGPGGPTGPGGPYGRQPETKKVPAWLWVLASIALVLALGIVGYIVWDSTQ